MINRLSVEKLETVCSDPSFSNNVIFTNFNPDFQLEKVLEAILEHRRVRAFSPDEKDSLKQFHSRESKNYQEVLMYPADEKDLDTMKKIQNEVLYKLAPSRCGPEALN